MTATSGGGGSGQRSVMKRPLRRLRPPRPRRDSSGRKTRATGCTVASFKAGRLSSRQAGQVRQRRGPVPGPDSRAGERETFSSQRARHGRGYRSIDELARARAERGGGEERETARESERWRTVEGGGRRAEGGGRGDKFCGPTLEGGDSGGSQAFGLACERSGTRLWDGRRCSRHRPRYACTERRRTTGRSRWW